MRPSSAKPTHDEAIAATKRWLERAVIGLNLCPFAKTVHVKRLVRYAVSSAQTSDALLDDLERELRTLVAAKPENVDTTLLILPYALAKFTDFADFLDLVEIALKVQGLTGVIQVASFHPQYRFADAEADDIRNFTNRSPYPIFHLLREESLARAIQAFPNPAVIYEQNMATLRALGLAGWLALGLDAPNAPQGVNSNPLDVD
ncbi:DUF1415 domain-containing protein [Rugosibacter aromaticivorans]|uniref:DUF1415 domain-containing protein n=1 Tax=Rugosibacter aromaticivorans TaxID=1565605 RepID=UPI000B2F5A97|nr:DUF1415 domain-containing protein [Rugosibacter aromaticivorans]TBR13354.1 MAG: DUF1415 domain-containing protein [Rugosibacter sp.]